MYQLDIGKSASAAEEVGGIAQPVSEGSLAARVRARIDDLPVH
jgi:hypothetical protein